MKTLTRVLMGAAVMLMMGLSACSSEEPTPTPTPEPEPDTPEVPVMPEHPDKDWKGENPHGFLTDATVIGLPITENGVLRFGKKEEIVIDTTMFWNNSSATSKNGATDVYIYTSRFWLDGKMADPFENQEDYIKICKEHRFRPKSQFSNFEELMGFNNTPKIYGYFSTEMLTSVDIITEKYFDKNHPAGSSMVRIDKVGINIRVMPAPFDFWEVGLDGMGGPGWGLMLGYPSYDPEYGANPAVSISLECTGFPEKAGEYPMTLKVTMNGGEKVLERKFIIKYVDKK